MKRRVKFKNHVTTRKQYRSVLQKSFAHSSILDIETKPGPKTGAFPINGHKPFRKNILPATHLE